MLWILLALILALPVLLGLVPGTDAVYARRIVLRCSLAGGFVGLLMSGFLFVVSSQISVDAGPSLLSFFPILWGAVMGAGIGLVGVVVRRFLAG